MIYEYRELCNLHIDPCHLIGGTHIISGLDLNHSGGRQCLFGWLWHFDAVKAKVACGLWPVACGLWPVACGLWPVACGLWACSTLEVEACIIVLHILHLCSTVILDKFDQYKMSLQFFGILFFTESYTNLRSLQNIGDVCYLYILDKFDQYKMSLQFFSYCFFTESYTNLRSLQNIGDVCYLYLFFSNELNFHVAHFVWTNKIIHVWVLICFWLKTC